MIYLSANTADQTIRLSLNEGRLWNDTFTHYLVVFTSKATLTEYPFIADVTAENNRITTITVGTADDDGENSSVLITDTGEYVYTVYGQNSSTNLDVDNAAVVGVVERGQLLISGAAEFYEETTATLPENDIIEDE